MTSYIYEQMRSKWGFHDGDAAPYNANEARAALIELINQEPAGRLSR